MKNYQLLFLLFLLSCNQGKKPGPTPKVEPATLQAHHFPPDKIYIRRNIGAIHPNDPNLAAYAKGVAVMKARPSSDPTSWAYQAAIHGIFDFNLTPQPGWNSCQHGSYFFLPWHRMYLYYFERMIRKASGYDNFSLPYWDYSDGNDSLPAAFRIPSNSASNSLYDKRDVNDGSALQPSVVAYQQSMLEPIFTSTDIMDPGFGGRTVPPGNLQWPHGVIEHQPHDQVHDAIGGEMDAPQTAANDPIFFLHHCNIDRLWVQWNRQGGQDPVADAAWMTTPFTLFDENGQPVTMTPQQVMDNRNQLGYDYDDVPVIHVTAVRPPLPFLRLDTSFKRFDYLTAPEAHTNGRRTDVPMTFSNVNKNRGLLQSVIATIADTSKRTGERIYLSLQGITFDKERKGIYEVYINLPKNTEPVFNSPWYAGNIGLFGLVPHHMAGHMQSSDNNSVLLNVTSTFRKMSLAHVDLNSITITVIHRGSTTRAEDAIKGNITIQKMVIYGMEKSR